MTSVGTAVLAALFAWPGVTWPAIKARIAKEFPNVKWVSTADLAKRLAEKDAPVLLDVRTAVEFDVSHLNGARRVDPNAESVALPKDTPIVTYCSVGYRSAKFAQRLEEVGFTNVQNLEGSIFQWANEGRSIGPSQKVHPYNSKWGVLLDASRRASVREAQ